MRENFKKGLGVLFAGGLLMGLSYWQTTVQADFVSGLGTTTRIMGVVFIIGVILVVLSLLYFLFAANSNKK